MGLGAGSSAHNNADMVSEGNSGAPSCSPQGLAPHSLHRTPQPTVPRCPPLAHCGQQGTEVGATAWRRPGCPGHLPLPSSKVRRPGWRALARRLLRPARQGGSTLGRPRAPCRTCFSVMVSGCRFPPCCPVAVAACWAGGGGRGGMSSPKLALCGEGRVGARQVGTGPTCYSAFAVHPTCGCRCLV